MVKVNNTSTIPRPLNCFLIYRLEKQQEIVAKCNGANHRDISKIIAKWWKEATEEEKRPFREKARLAKLEHKRLYPEYKYAPQKKVAPKRIYIRKNKKHQFTSRVEGNNELMEMIYENPDFLEMIPVAQATETKKKSIHRKSSKKSKKVSSSNDSPTLYSNDSPTLYSNDSPTLYSNDSPTLYSNDSPMLYDDKEHPQCQFSQVGSSYISPYTETYSEYDIASPFNNSIASFEMDQNYGMPTPATYDMSYATDFNICTNPNNQQQVFNYFNYTQINETCTDIKEEQSNNYYTAVNLSYYTAAFPINTHNFNFIMQQQHVEYINPSLLYI